MFKHSTFSDRMSHQRSPVYLTPPPIAPSGTDLSNLLRAPETQCDLDAFCTALSVRDVIFECEGDGPMAQHPGFPAAVRQVIGAELMKSASQEALGGLDCPWTPACGLHVFFNGEAGSGDVQLPPPWVIRTDTTGANSLRITLRLFGVGLLWSSELSEACHRAIEKGIFLAGVGPLCTHVLIRSVEQVWTGLQDPAPDANQVLVTFVTPFQARKDTDAADVAEAFLLGLQKRMEDIARWHGIGLDDDASLTDAVTRVRHNDKGLGPIEWNRSISQQGGANISMKGQMGLMQLQLPDDDRDMLVRHLQLGELLHAGGNIAFGQGRFDLFLVDGSV